MIKHILLVDDEEPIRLSMKMGLEGDGLEITEALNGCDALDLIKAREGTEEEISLIITDLHMPIMGGMELIDGARKLERRIPILVITGFGDKEILVQLIRKGVDDFIDKPFRVNELREKVERILFREEELQQKQKNLTQKVEEDMEALQEGISRYRLSYEKLSKQVTSAKDAYKNLITLKDGGYKVKMAHRVKPLAFLGGDFFDIRDTETGCDVFVADVSGHDMGASYNAVLLKAFFDENCRTGKDGATFFRMLNEQLLENNQVARMVTGVFARFNLEENHAEITSAAHPPVCIVRKKYPALRLCEGKGGPLGVDPDMEFEANIVDFSEGDRLVFYTDGLPRAQKFCRETGKRVELTEAGIDEMILKHSNEPLEEMVASIWDDIFVWCRKKPNDDMLLVGIEV